MVGRRDPSEYKFIEAVLHWDSRKKECRVHPASGQIFPEDMHIECSKAIRRLPTGTRIEIKVVEKEPKEIGMRPHLYTSYKWDHKILGN